MQALRTPQYSADIYPRNKTSDQPVLQYNKQYDVRFFVVQPKTSEVVEWRLSKRVGDEYSGLSTLIYSGEEDNVAAAKLAVKIAIDKDKGEQLSKRHLWVSGELSAINDLDNSRFVMLGEVFDDYYEPPFVHRGQENQNQTSSSKMGIWRIEIGCDLDTAYNAYPENHNQVFRIVSGSGCLGRIGEFSFEVHPDAITEACGSIWIGIDVVADSTVRQPTTLETAKEQRII